MNYIIIPIFTILLLGGTVIFNAYGHVTVEVEPYEIEVGWEIEPPVVGYRNAIVYEITESPSEGVRTGIINAFKNLQSTVSSGGVSKVLDIDSDPRPGHYFSKIIPTKTGSIEIDLEGDINGVPVDITIPIEDVENTAVLDFPPKATAGPSEIGPIKNALSSLQSDVSEIKEKLEGVDQGGEGFSVESAFNFGVFGLSLGAAGVVLAIIAMIKRK